MDVESAKQDIKGSYGEGFVIMGTDRIEISPDGKRVTAWTNDGVETKAASDAQARWPDRCGRSGAAAPLEGSKAAPINKDTFISISADFNTVVLNGAAIERAADGHLVISTSGTVITKPGPANGTAAKAKAAPDVGDEMEDGTILAGYYEGKPLYATPRDAPAPYSFNQAAEYAKKLDAHGHHDFHVPSEGELNILWDNRDKGKLKGTFHYATYWSSSQFYYTNAWVQRFSDGNQHSFCRGDGAYLRCVRG